MAKIFEVDYRQGSLVEKVNKIVPTLTGTVPFSKAEKGMALRNRQSGDYNYGAITAFNNIGTNPFSVEVAFTYRGYKNIGSSDNCLLGNSTNTTTNGISFIFNSADRISVVFTSGSGVYSIISTDAATPFKIGKNYLLSVVFDGVTYRCFVNGLLQTSNSTTVRNITSTNNFYIGTESSTTQRRSNADVYLVRIHNSAISQQEINASYNNFLAGDGYLTQKRNISAIKPTDLSRLKDTGLVAAYNMQPKDNTLVDISGSGNNLTLTGGNTNYTKEGVSFSSSGYYKKTSFVGLQTGLNTNAYTMSMRIKFNEAGREQHLFELPGVQRYISVANKLILSGASNPLISNQSVILGKWYTVSFLIKNPGVEIYVNGVSDNSNVNYTENISALTMIIGHFSSEAGAYRFNGEISDARVYNRILTIQEIKDYHNSFNDITLIEDFSDQPANNATSIVPTGWELVSGAFKVGEHTMANRELVINGGFDTNLSSWSPGIDWTWLNGTAKHKSLGGNERMIQNCLTVGKSYKISFDVVTSNLLGNIEIKCGVSNTKTYLTPTIGSYTFTSACVGNTFLYILGNVAWEGSIDNVSVTEVPPLPTIQNGTKYLECISQGTLAIPSQQAYGTWEFDFYKGGDNTRLSVDLVSSKTSDNLSGSYMFYSDIDEALYLRRGGENTALKTANSYITNSTWYRARITRTITGVFTVMIKGGAFVPTAGYDGYTLVSAAGGSGANPVTDNNYTVSNYLLLDIDNGDRVANIKLLPYIKQ